MKREAGRFDGDPMTETCETIEGDDLTVGAAKELGYRIIEPEPEGFKRIIAGREAVRVRSEL